MASLGRMMFGENRRCRWDDDCLTRKCRFEAVLLMRKHGFLHGSGRCNRCPKIPSVHLRAVGGHPGERSLLSNAPFYRCPAVIPTVLLRVSRRPNELIQYIMLSCSKGRLLQARRGARNVYRTQDQVRAEVFDYIERFHNPTRRHWTVGYVSAL